MHSSCNLIKSNNTSVKGDIEIVTECVVTEEEQHFQEIENNQIKSYEVIGASILDKARKDSLVNYGFRLPSAYDNRPLKFEEFEDRINQVVFVSATPAEYEKEHGIAAICPATMTLPKQRLMEICKNAKEYKDIQMNTKSLEKNNEQVNTSEKLKAKLVGINLEGPFISPDRVGAQNPEYVQKPDAEMLQELIDESGNMVKLVTIAPERGGAIECISKLYDKVRFSVGHTMANYDEATLAYESGAKHATHLYNAMTGLNHRNPGVVGAARDAKNVTAELICDGVHIHPSVVRATFSMFGSDRVILISDSMRACGMPDGESELGGQVVIKKGNEARLVTGELAGSVTNVYGCMVKAIEFGIPIADAIKAATYNPAKAIGILDEFGTIEIGKKPGFVLVNEDFSINQVL